VKSPVLRLGLSSSSELEESSLEKLRSLRAAHAQNIIFWNFFFFVSPKRYFFLPSPLSLELFRLLQLYLLEESNFFLLGQSAMKWVVSPHSKQPVGDFFLSSCSCFHTFAAHLGSRGRVYMGLHTPPGRSPKWRGPVSRDS
jgi:hypothetical protein